MKRPPKPKPFITTMKISNTNRNRLITLRDKDQTLNDVVGMLIDYYLESVDPDDDGNGEDQEDE